MMKHYSFLLLLLLLIIPFLNACSATGVVAGAGATTGIAASQEGGIRTAARDTGIRLEISDLWFKKDTDLFSRLSLTVQNGRVLITGVVRDADARVEAVRLAWQAEGVVQVINEIQIRENGRSWSSFANDNWLATKLRTKITFDKHIKSINYSIDVVESVVYLMGVAQDQKEVDLVIDHARNIAGVTQVISYVRLKDEPIKTAG